MRVVQGGAYDIYVLQIAHILHLALDELKNDAAELDIRSLVPSSYRQNSPLALLFRLVDARPDIFAHQIMPFELGRGTSTHRMLERLQHACCLQVLERLDSFQEEVRVRIALSRLLRDGLEHILVPL